MSRDEVVPIEDQAQSSALNEAIGRTVQELNDSRLLIRKREDWIAAPRVGHLSNDICDSIASLMKGEQLLACLLVRQTHSPNTYRVSATPGGIRALALEMNMADYVLSPEDLSWMLISIESECLIVAGELHVVTAILGKELNLIYADFESFLSKSDNLGLVKMGRSILEVLQQQYARAGEGHYVLLPEADRSLPR